MEITDDGLIECVTTDFSLGQMFYLIASKLRCGQDEEKVRNCTSTTNTECKKKEPSPGSSSGTGLLQCSPHFNIIITIYYLNMWIVVVDCLILSSISQCFAACATCGVFCDHLSGSHGNHRVLQEEMQCYR